MGVFRVSCFTIHSLFYHIRRFLPSISDPHDSKILFYIVLPPISRSSFDSFCFWSRFVNSPNSSRFLHSFQVTRQCHFLCRYVSTSAPSTKFYFVVFLILVSWTSPYIPLNNFTFSYRDLLDRIIYHDEYRNNIV